MYLNIFGGEYGWTFHREVMLELHRGASKNWMQDGRLYKYTAFAWLFACLFVILLFVFHHMNSRLITTLMLIFSAPVGVVVFTGTVWSVMEYISNEIPPQAWIEQELQRCTRNSTMARTL